MALADILIDILPTSLLLLDFLPYPFLKSLPFAYFSYWVPCAQFSPLPSSHLLYLPFAPPFPHFPNQTT